MLMSHSVNCRRGTRNKSCVGVVSAGRAVHASYAVLLRVARRVCCDRWFEGSPRVDNAVAPAAAKGNAQTCLEWRAMRRVPLLLLERKNLEF